MSATKLHRLMGTPRLSVTWPSPRTRWSIAICSRIAIVALLTTLISCGGGGKLTIKSEAEKDKILKRGFDSAIYGRDSGSNITVLLFDGPVESPSQAMTIRMLWAPRAAQTPIDPGATNASIRYIVFTGPDHREVGMYSGAGYLYTSGKIGQSRLPASLWQANLRLTGASDDYEDPFGPVSLTGSFSAVRRDAQIQQHLRRLAMLITARLGYPQFVSTD